MMYINEYEYLFLYGVSFTLLQVSKYLSLDLLNWASTVVYDNHNEENDHDDNDHDDNNDNDDNDNDNVDDDNVDDDDDDDDIDDDNNKNLDFCIFFIKIQFLSFFQMFCNLLNEQPLWTKNHNQ